MQAFFLLDHVTNAEQRLATRRQHPKLCTKATDRKAFFGVHAAHGLHGHSKATQAQREDALEVALESGNTQMVRQLLDEHGGMNLDIHVLAPWQTPLMWATAQEDLNLVIMFLTHGADPGFTFASTGFKAAIAIAVEKKNRQIVDTLVQQTTPLLCTRALGLAIDQDDVEMAQLLLANGVKCDFEVLDVPIYTGHKQQGCLIRNSSDAVEFTPPLFELSRWAKRSWCDSS